MPDAPYAQTVEQYLTLPWTVSMTYLPDDECYSLTIAELNDFEIFHPDKDALEAELHDALSSHLQAYLVTGKPIPVPASAHVPLSGR